MTEMSKDLRKLLTLCEKELEQSMLPVAVFGSDEVFQREMEQIFGRCWVFLGHVTEIPNVGDYVVRRIGLDQVIVVRDDSGEISVLSNFCRHRGTELCQEDRGSGASTFTCPYHGWVYKNNGDWMSAPHVAQAYRELDPKQWGLNRVPNVGVHQGLIFANVAADAEPLLDYLGGAAWFLDALLGLHPDGMRVTGPPTRWRVQTDWKSAAEQFGGDNYHVDNAHISLDDIGMFPGMREMHKFNHQYDLECGHIFTGHDFPAWFGPEGWEYWAFPKDITDQFDLSVLDDAQRHLLKSSIPVTGTIFPNLSWLRFPGSADPANVPFATYSSFRQWQPVAPGVMELWSWQLVWNCGTDEYNKACYDAGQNAFSASGMFEQDDTVVWEGLPRMARSVFPGGDTPLNYQLGFNGMSTNAPDPTWQGPGIARKGGLGEQNQRAFYTRWLKEMQKES